LVDFHTSAQGEPCDVVRKIRPVLETHYRDQHPNDFTQSDSLGEIIRKIREAGTAHPLAAILDDLESLNTYTTPYEHGQPGTVMASIDDNELHSFVKKTLMTVGCC
jgi:hypothetical protein